MNRSSTTPGQRRPSGGDEAPKPRGTFQKGSHFNRGEGNRVAPRYSATSQRRSASRPAQVNPYSQAGSRTRQRGPAHGSASRVQGSHVYRSDGSPRQNQPFLSEPIITNQAEGYQTRAPHQKPLKKRSKAPIVLACVVGALFIAAFGVYLWWANAMINVTVNGTEAEVRRGTTVEQLVSDGYATPAAGNLLAIDGSLLTQGGGEPFTATVNGTKVSPGYAVADGNTIEVANGGDLTEETTTEQVAIPHGTGGDSMENFAGGAIHSYTEGQDGVKEVTTGTVSGLTQENVIQEPVDAGYHKYDVDTGGEKVVALTFDDGPWPDSSDAILDILAENGAKATFFTIGQQIPEYGEATKRAAAEGHQICTHSYDHADGSGQGVNLTFMTPEEQIEEIQKGYQAIEDATGQEASTVIRSPGGNFYGELVTNLQPYITADIGWDIDTEDWRRPGVDSIVAQIESAYPGAVILMHDGGGDRSQTVEALKIALPYLREQGYSFVTIDELMQYPPVSSDTSY